MLKNDVSQDCMQYLGYIFTSGDYNPDGAWSIGSKYPESTKYGWQNYARFNDDGEVDPNGNWPPEPCPPV